MLVGWVLRAVQKTLYPAQSVPEGPLKIILQWPTSSYGGMDGEFRSYGRIPFLDRKCKVSDCYITYDEHLLNDITDYDAIIMHAPMIRSLKTRPSKRSERQKYILESIESSQYYPICDSSYDNFFYWTWSYKLDSDLPKPYVVIRNLEGDVIGPNRYMHWIDVDKMKPVNDELKERLSTKTKVAAWFVSNCHAKSRRNELVQELQEELEKFNLRIDVYGNCNANKHCPRDKLRECFKLIEKDYYFYMSLENSCAEDYVTEKLLTALQNYAIRVVLGGANYTRFMPNGIYLDAGKMRPAELAREMHDVIKEKGRYHRFFKWRSHYSYGAPDTPDTDTLCGICEMLHNETLLTREAPKQLAMDGALVTAAPFNLSSQITTMVLLELLSAGANASAPAAALDASERALREPPRARPAGAPPAPALRLRSKRDAEAPKNKTGGIGRVGGGGDYSLMILGCVGGLGALAFT